MNCDNSELLSDASSCNVCMAVNCQHHY